MWWNTPLQIDYFARTNWLSVPATAWKKMYTNPNKINIFGGFWAEKRDLLHKNEQKGAELNNLLLQQLPKIEKFNKTQN